MQGSTGSFRAALVAALGVSALAALPPSRPARGAGPPSTRGAPAPGRRADQEALKGYAPLVGSWRGVGQVERGKTKGAWTEKVAWAWKLTSDSAGLEATFTKGKYLRSGVLRPGKEPGTLTFEATLADGSKRTFTGGEFSSKNITSLSLSADPKTPAGGVQAIRITPLHDTRLLILLQSRDPDGHTLSRLGEVGYTREGVAFAAGESYPLCIVTEGRGTTQVSYKGKTYWVCCSGCRDLFNDDPEGVLAEAAAREKAKGKK